jgi:hypothetical protein
MRHKPQECISEVITPERYIRGVVGDTIGTLSVQSIDVELTDREWHVYAIGKIGAGKSTP